MYRLISSFTFIACFSAVLGNVNQCYLCNSAYCGDNYDWRLGAVTSCSDLYKNAVQYSSNLIDANSTGLKDVEVIDADANNSSPSERIFDFQRKLWELFNKGEVDQYTEFACVKAIYSYQNQILTYRGCAPKSTKSYSTACDYVNNKVSKVSTGSVSSCYTCDTNLCNSARTLIPVSALFTIIFYVLIFI